MNHSVYLLYFIHLFILTLLIHAGKYVGGKSEIIARYYSDELFLEKKKQTYQWQLSRSEKYL